MKYTTVPPSRQALPRASSIPQNYGSRDALAMLLITVILVKAKTEQPKFPSSIFSMEQKLFHQCRMPGYPKRGRLNFEYSISER